MTNFKHILLWWLNDMGCGHTCVKSFKTGSSYGTHTCKVPLAVWYLICGLCARTVPSPFSDIKSSDNLLFSDYFTKTVFYWLHKSIQFLKDTIHNYASTNRLPFWDSSLYSPRTSVVEMAFCYQNCSELLWEKLF